MITQTVNSRLGIGLTALSCMGLLGCSEGAHADDTDRSSAVIPVSESPSWVQPSVGGTTVALSVGPTPLVAGLLNLVIRVEPTPDDVLPITLDLVSPEMPIHGILRYESRPTNPAEYVAEIEIPMEGFWELYVNLDYGADAAVFELDVAPAKDGGGHVHGSDGAASNQPVPDERPAHEHGSGS